MTELDIARDADETRHRETPFGVIRCPNCHPRAEESA